MPDTSAENILNEENNSFIIENTKKSGIINNYLSNWNIHLLSYMPFLINSSNLDIVNLSKTTNFTSENLVTNNGYIDSDIVQDPEDPERNLNGEFRFLKTDTQKDLYYKTKYNATNIDVFNDSSTNYTSARYIEDDFWHNFMFYFSTDDITPRVLGIFNSNVVMYISDEKYLTFSLNMIDYKSRKLYNIKLQLQDVLEVNETIHIGLFRYIRGTKYKYVLFINGEEYADQLLQSSNGYEYLKAEDKSDAIYQDKPEKTIFWFHEEPNIHTVIDELYTFSMNPYTDYFGIPPLTVIKPYPLFAKLILPTEYSLMITFKNKHFVQRNIKCKKKFLFNVERDFRTKFLRYTKRSVISDVSKLLPRYYITRIVRLTKDFKFRTNLKSTHSFKYSTHVKSIINSYSKFDRSVVNAIKLKNSTLRKIKQFLYTRTNIQYQTNIKFDTNTCYAITSINFYERIILQTRNTHFSLKLNNKITIAHNQDIARNLSPEGTYVHATRRLLAKKLTTIFDNIDDISKLDLKPTEICRNVVYQDENNPLINNNINRKIISTINLANDLSRKVKSVITVYFSTKTKNNDADEYISDINRKVIITNNFIFKNTLIRKIIIPFRSRTRSRRFITINAFNSITNEYYIKPINIYRIVSKTITISNSTFLHLTPGKQYRNKTKRNIHKIINMKALLSRNIKYLANVPWVFVVDTEYYT